MVEKVIDGPKKDFVYADKTQTQITLERPSQANPYVCDKRYTHGYDTEDLVENRGLVDVLFLMFKGELPEPIQATILEKLMVGMMNLGPRHPAVKSAMIAGVSKANVEHLLPIGLSVLGGANTGAKDVALAMRFIKSRVDQPDTNTSDLIAGAIQNREENNESQPFPGFGHHCGSTDLFVDRLAHLITPDMTKLQHTEYFSWASCVSEQLNPHHMGWLTSGLAAAVFLELGLSERQAIGLFQLICAPGIFAHGVEQTHLPITAIPMLNDEQFIETQCDEEK